jgi:hypothetical protein
MKKIILSLAAVLAFTLTTDAQTRKGTVLLGAGRQFSEQNINSCNRSSTFNRTARHCACG